MEHYRYGCRLLRQHRTRRALGVTVQHVRRLADSGELIQVARGLIDRDSTVDFFGLQAGPSGNVMLRATGFDLRVVRDLALQGVVLAALDAATSRALESEAPGIAHWPTPSTGFDVDAGNHGRAPGSAHAPRSR